MNEMDVSRVLAQIRSLQSQAAGAPPRPVAVGAAQEEGGFAGVLKTAIGEVNRAQTDAAQLQRSFALGDKDTDLSTVMLAGAKAQVQFKAMTEVRNRLVAAYQDIMNMPL
ncbi:MAG: flagellar hook-basal body complex protein FliE [Solimonas sp.]